MAWRQTCPVDERLSLMLELDRGERSMSELCRVLGVSRKSGYKWLARYREQGVNGLADRSRAPLNHPNAVDEALVDPIVQLRRRYPDWGPQKLRLWLQRRHPERGWPVSSTLAEILKRAGLVKPRRMVRRAVPFGAPLAHADRPNALWSADFKGHFRTGDSRYCYPLTVSDNYSRYLLECRALTGYRFIDVRPWFERVFREYGLPQAIRTDNGAPFASKGVAGLSRLTVWWIKLGIIPEHIEPGKPQQNARHERMHGTLKRAACRPRTDAAGQQQLFDCFRNDYNTERPHQALKGQTPAMCHQRSSRPYPEKLPELEYPEGMYLRRVLPSGDLRWLGQRMHCSEALIGETVGLRLIEDGLWLLYVGPIAVGRLDARVARIEPIKPFIEVPTLH